MSYGSTQCFVWNMKLKLLKKIVILSIFKAKWGNNGNLASLVTKSYPSVLLVGYPSQKTLRPLEAVNVNGVTDKIRNQRGHICRGMKHWLPRRLQGRMGYRLKKLKSYKGVLHMTLREGKKAKSGRSRTSVHLAFTPQQGERSSSHGSIFLKQPNFCPFQGLCISAHSLSCHAGGNIWLFLRFCLFTHKRNTFFFF